MNNGKVLSTIGIFIIAPVMMFAYITGPGPDKGYDRCPDGYEPHLYKNGLCLERSHGVEPGVERRSHLELVVYEQVDILVHRLLVDHALGVVLVV